MSERPGIGVRRAVDPGWWCQLILVVLAINAPAFAADDAWLFNYFNNVAGAPPLFYNSGYVHLLPQLTGYSVSGLPLVVQAVLYRLVPLVLVICLFRQLRRLFAANGHAEEAWMPAMAIMVVLRVREPGVFGELAYSTWLAFLVAFTCVLHLHQSKERYSPLAAAGVVVGALTLPLGVLLAPLCLVHAIRDKGARRWQNAAIAAVILAVDAFVFAGVPENPVVLMGPLDTLEIFVRGFRQNKLDNLVAVASVLILMGNLVSAPWLSDRRSPAGASVLIVRWSLSYLGVLSLAAFVASDRFLHHGLGFDGIAPRFALPAVACALMAVALAVVARPAERDRLMLLGSGLGGAAALLAVLMYTQLRGPLETSLMRYRFLAVAAEFRDTCRDGDAILYEDDDSSPLILCRPRALGEGYHEFPDLPPSIGVGFARTDGLPGIQVGKPLF